MTHFRLHGPSQSNHTLVSDQFLDNYMPTANGEYVKVYLYLLRCLKSSTQELSIPLIAEKFERTESDINIALKYWERMHLLTLEYDDSKSLTGIHLTDAFPAVSNSEPVSPAAAAPAVQSSAASIKPLSQAEARQLLFVCEKYLGKTLTSSEVRKILDFHDRLGFSPELIDYLIDYCVTMGHKGMPYISSVALAWHEKGYTTVRQAKEQTSIYNKAYFSILKAFGISGRNPGKSEILYMDKWMKELGFSLELITEACNRTIKTIHKISFEYADGILSDWKKKKVLSVADLEPLDAQHRTEKTSADTPDRRKAGSGSSNRFHNFPKHNYNIKELEKKLINQ